jgi:hypothetical protein
MKAAHEINNFPAQISTYAFEYDSNQEDDVQENTREKEQPTTTVTTTMHCIEHGTQKW